MDIAAPQQKGEQQTRATPKDARNGAHRGNLDAAPFRGRGSGTALGGYKGLAAQGCGFLEVQRESFALQIVSGRVGPPWRSGSSMIPDDVCGDRHSAGSQQEIILHHRGRDR